VLPVQAEQTLFVTDCPYVHTPSACGSAIASSSSRKRHMRAGGLPRAYIYVRVWGRDGPMPPAYALGLLMLLGHPVANAYSDDPQCDPGGADAKLVAPAAGLPSKSARMYCTGVQEVSTAPSDAFPMPRLRYTDAPPKNRGPPRTGTGAPHAKPATSPPARYSSAPSLATL
jgi:hypothetical protein